MFHRSPQLEFLPMTIPSTSTELAGALIRGLTMRAYVRLGLDAGDGPIGEKEIALAEASVLESIDEMIEHLGRFPKPMVREANQHVRAALSAFFAEARQERERRRPQDAQKH